MASYETCPASNQRFNFVHNILLNNKSFIIILFIASFHIKFQNGYINKEFVKQNFAQCMRLKKVRHKRIWGNFVGISLLISVRRLERSESPQGVVAS